MGIEKAVDRSIHIRNILLPLIPDIQIVILSDNASCVECIKSINPQCSEKRLLVTLAEIKQSLVENSIEIYHVEGKNNC